ncbi:MAG: N-acetyl-gamma-glutamyl-phosphate reductase [Candidatus Metalachnospira sp.]|nr:N-acetyl-gamma-glutamyl-phosphate reductase [Candidatus Metalachnospira sp.]
MSNKTEETKKTRIFIDGREGTTGLRIYDRLADIDDIELIVLSEEDRKNTEKRKEALNSSDISFLCLPDAAAIEAAELVENENTVLIDTSTAHRTDPDWAYGMPELSEEHMDKIINSKRIAVPGCHASGFIALIYPLIEKGVISKDLRLSCFSLTGYSGGGKNMIAEYNDSVIRNDMYKAPRQYGLTQNHKHLKEMKEITGLKTNPVFCPIIADYYSGMEVTVPLFKEDLNDGYTVKDIKKLYKEKYNGKIISYVEGDDENGFMSAIALSGYDNMQISVKGNDERILLVARYDNLGKGASGAALECLNYKLGKDITSGLNIKE